MSKFHLPCSNAGGSDHSKNSENSKSKHKDPKDILAGFLANDLPALESEYRRHHKQGRENQLATRGRNDTLEDVVSLSPDDTRDIHTNSAKSLENLAKEESVFGGYTPSCLSTSKPDSAGGRKQLAGLFPSYASFKLMEKENTAGHGDSCEDMKKYGRATERTLLETTGASVVTALQTQSVGFTPCPILPTCDSGNIPERCVARNPPLEMNHLRQEKLEKATLLPEDGAMGKKVSDSGDELQLLRDENISLREEIMKIESEKLKLEKEILEKDLLYDEQTEKRLSKEKEEMQRVTDQLTSEVAYLKQTSLFAEERIDSVRKAHQNEVHFLKTMHLRELDAKEKQFASEKAFLKNTSVVMSEFPQLLKRVDEWSSKFEQLYDNMIDLKKVCAEEKQNRLCDMESSLSDVYNQLERIVGTLDNAVQDMKSLQVDEKNFMSTAHAFLQQRQESFQHECKESLEIAQGARKRLEEIQRFCSEDGVLLRFLEKLMSWQDKNLSSSVQRT